MLADIPTYSVLDSQQILQSNENGVGNPQRDRHPGSLSQANFTDELESGPILSSGSFLNFHFPNDFIGGQ